MVGCNIVGKGRSPLELCYNIAIWPIRPPSQGFTTRQPDCMYDTMLESTYTTQLDNLARTVRPLQTPLRSCKRAQMKLTSMPMCVFASRSEPFASVYRVMVTRTGERARQPTRICFTADLGRLKALLRYHWIPTSWPTSWASLHRPLQHHEPLTCNEGCLLPNW